MYIFNWSTHVQKGHMSFYTTILHWQLVGRRKNSFLEDHTYLRLAAVSNCKPVYGILRWRTNEFEKGSVPEYQQISALHILCQKKRRNSVSLTLNAFVNAQSSSSFFFLSFVCMFRPFIGAPPFCFSVVMLVLIKVTN